MIAYFILVMVFYWVALAVMLYREAQTRKLARAEHEDKLETKED
jgi:heme/copper-type cytochrome/quinol oxidase subunit 2